MDLLHRSTARSDTLKDTIDQEVDIPPLDRTAHKCARLQDGPLVTLGENLIPLDLRYPRRSPAAPPSAVSRGKCKCGING